MLCLTKREVYTMYLIILRSRAVNCGIPVCITEANILYKKISEIGISRGSLEKELLLLAYIKHTN